MIELESYIEFWHWWVLGVLLMIVEVFLPGAFFLWLGVGAGIVGVVLLVLPGLSWEVQALIFAVLSVASIVAWRAYRRLHPPPPSDEPRLNQRAAQYIDRVFTLDEAIVNGVGKLRVDDTTWKVAGDDLPGGTRVKVVGVDGAILKVVAA